MRSSLLGIVEGLRSALSSPRLLEQFQRLVSERPALKGLHSPAVLLEHQRSPVPGPEAHDRVLHSLITAHQQDPHLRVVTATLLLLAMSPALGNVISRTARLYPCEEDCAGDVCEVFLAGIAAWNPRHQSGIALALKLNTLRSILRRKACEWNDHRRGRLAARAALPLLDQDGQVEATASAFWQLSAGQQGYTPDDLELRRVRLWLTEETGVSARDAEILVLKDLCGLPWNAIAERIGMTPAAACKQYFRLRPVLRTTPVLSDSCPGLEGSMCIPSLEGEDARIVH